MHKIQENAHGMLPKYTQTVYPETKYPWDEPLCLYCGKIKVKKQGK